LKSRRTLLAAALSSVLVTPAFAQSGAPLKLVVTFTPGGSTDIVARILQPELASRLDRNVIVENKPGAASQLGTDYVARSRPDGNTLLVSFDSHAINPVVKPRLPYDTFKDFAGVALVVRFPLILGASPSVKAKDLRGFLNLARRDPGRYSYASTGVGSLNHLAMEDIKRRAGVFLLHVPYSGGATAMQAVLGDVSQVTLLSYAAMKGQIAAGKIRPLAVTGTQRLPELPDVPTVAESGLPQFEAYSWIGLFAPAATPPETVKRLTEAVEATLQVREVKEKLSSAGFEIVAGDGPSADRYTLSQYERWSAFVKTTGLKLEE